MGNYNFNDDIKIGDMGENNVINHLKNLGGTLLSKNNNNQFDAIIQRKNKLITYEIKTDVFCKLDWDTGNIFVEFECRGKKSGLAVTKADWFVNYFYYLDEIWYIKSNDLINLINENKHNLIIKNFSGDKNSNTKGFLVPRWKFYHHFKIYNAKTFEKLNHSQLKNINV